ncbi:ankyrin repeat domain-containing protein 34C [Ambystoma mexicanum]|uniref:ankyrin repeat domain-containing protein 34C n=1 Tax=Ambystoma mexicanum TaxID=8296 RepID=UPI0037E7DB39
MDEVRELRTDGNSLLKAVWMGRLRLARLLLEGGAYINESNEKGETALMIACLTTHQDQQSSSKGKMVKYLLERQADPNIQDKAGCTALIHACLSGAGGEVVSLLLGNGADPSLEDHTGASALVHAINMNDQEVLEHLVTACKAKGKEVIIITTDKSTSGSHTTTRYLNVPPSARLEESRPRSLGQGMAPSDFQLKSSDLISPTSGKAEDALNFHTVHSSMCYSPKVPSDQPSPARKTANPRRARLPQLKRLQSEPWGLIAPSVLAASQCHEEPKRIGSDEGSSQGLGELPFSRKTLLSRSNSAESKDGATLFPSLGDQARRGSSSSAPVSRKTSYEQAQSPHQPLTRHCSVPVDQESPDSTPAQGFLLVDPKSGAEHYESDSQLYCGSGQAFVPDHMGKAAPERKMLGSSHSRLSSSSRDSLDSSSSASPGAARHRPPGLLERRGSGTLLLDHISHTRPGHLPPLNINPGPPIPDIGSKSTSSLPFTGGMKSPASFTTLSALRLDHRSKKKLLRRHSMQAEQMKHLLASEEILLL